MTSASHIHVAQLHYHDLIAEVERDRLAAQARSAATTPSTRAQPRMSPRGDVRSVARRALAVVAALPLLLANR
jgi:hypothetical protein